MSVNVTEVEELPELFSYQLATCSCILTICLYLTSRRVISVCVCVCGYREDHSVPGVATWERGRNDQANT
jgi:hypothetical protein